MGTTKNSRIKQTVVLLVLGQFLAFGACKPPKREAERNPVPEYAIGELEERRKRGDEDEEEDEGSDQPGRRSTGDAPD